MTPEINVNHRIVEKGFSQITSSQRIDLDRFPRIILTNEYEIALINRRGELGEPQNERFPYRANILPAAFPVASSTGNTFRFRFVWSGLQDGPRRRYAYLWRGPQMLLSYGRHTAPNPEPTFRQTATAGPLRNPSAVDSVPFSRRKIVWSMSRDRRSQSRLIFRQLQNFYRSPALPYRRDEYRDTRNKNWTKEFEEGQPSLVNIINITFPTRLTNYRRKHGRRRGQR